MILTSDAPVRLSRVNTDLSYGDQQYEAQADAVNVGQCLRPPWRAALRGKVKRKAADRLLHFVSERREMIRYPEFRERGWQIGSGPTESQCQRSSASQYRTRVTVIPPTGKSQGTTLIVSSPAVTMVIQGTASLSPPVSCAVAVAVKSSRTTRRDDNRVAPFPPTSRLGRCRVPWTT
jgi:hypothetical protein